MLAASAQWAKKANIKAARQRVRMADSDDGSQVGKQIAVSCYDKNILIICWNGTDDNCLDNIMLW